MKQIDRILLTLIAGFCDAATFVHMGGIFSAHITGNFILFAAALAQGVTGEDFLKILTFPVFLLAILVATFVHKPVTSENEGQGRLRVYRWITAILGIVAVLSLFFSVVTGNKDLYWVDAVFTMMIVFAMGMQNTLHHFIAGPMTTVMTGTVMNATASWGQKIFFESEGDQPTLVAQTPIKPVWMIAGFAAGCIGGALMTYYCGFASMVIPVSVMIILSTDNRLKKYLVDKFQDRF